MTSISIPGYDICYEEGENFQVYMAVVKLENGRGDLVSVIAPDDFSAGIMAKMLSKKVLFMMPLSDLLGNLQDKIDEFRSAGLIA